MSAIHESTLEKLFRKNFYEEIRRLAIGDGRMDSAPLSPSVKSPGGGSKPSLYERSMNQSLTSVLTSRPTQNGFSGPMSPPLPQLPGLLSAGLNTAESQYDGQPSPAQTPLQRHLAHLVRHGFNGVASRPDNDSHLSQSPPNSTANLPGDHLGSVSTASGTGSGSIKARLSNKFGSLNFGRG